MYLLFFFVKGSGLRMLIVMRFMGLFIKYWCRGVLLDVFEGFFVV